MTPSTPPHPPSGKNGAEPLPRDVERALALRDVMQHAVEVERAAAAPARARRSRTTLVLALLCVPLLAASVYSYVARPEAVWGPRPESAPPVRVEANTRFTMFFVAQRLADHRRRTGTLPASLAEIGLDAPGVTYRVAGDSGFELRAMAGAKRLVLRSDDNWDAFLAPSASLIRGGRR